MTVAALIAKLQKMPPNAEVFHLVATGIKDEPEPVDIVVCEPNGYAGKVVLW